MLFGPDPDPDASPKIPVRLHVFGSLIFNRRVTSSLSYIRFKHEKIKTINTSGNQIAVSLNFYHTGTYQIYAHSNTLSENVNLFKPGTTIIEDSVLIGNRLNMTKGSLVLDTSYISAPSISLIGGSVNITRSDVQTLNWSAKNLVEFKSDSSTIYVGKGESGSFDGGHLSYFDVYLCGGITVSGNNNYNKLSFCPGSDIYLPANQKQTADTLIVAGDPGFPISVSSTSDDVQAVIRQNGGTVNGTYLYLKDSKAEGADFFAYESIDLGNVDGWNITEQVSNDFYWVGGTGLWSEYRNHWATTSGGTTFHDRIPGALDDIYFDEQSFPGNTPIVEIDQIKTYSRNLDFSSVNNEFNVQGGNELWIFGSFLFSEQGKSGLSVLKFPSDTASHIINSGGKRIAHTLLFHHKGKYDLITSDERISNSMFIHDIGQVSLFGTLDLGGKLVVTKGAFISNNRRIIISEIDFGYNSTGSPKPVVDIGHSHVTTNSWMVGRSVKFLNDSSEIDVLAPGQKALFYGGDKKYHKVNAACIVDFRDNNSFDLLTLTYGAKISIQNEQTVRELIAVGTSGNPIEISGGSFRKTSGRVRTQYLILEKNSARGGADFRADRSINRGGNSGWDIRAPLVNIDANELDVLNGDPLCGQAIETTLSLPSGLLTTFQWFKDGSPINVDSSAVVVREEGIYHVELTNACGTVAKSNEVDISREGPPEVPEIYTEGSTSVCKNDPIEVEFHTDEQPRVHYNWMRDGQNFGYDESFVSIDTVGTYRLQLVKGECIVHSEDSVIVAVKDDIPISQQLTLLGNDTICLGDSSRMTVPYEIGTTYSWINGDTTISTQSNYFEAKEEGIYTLEMHNGCGVRQANGSVNLIVKKVPENHEILIDGPDTFCWFDSTLLEIPYEEEVIYTWYSNTGDPVNNFNDNKAYTDTSGAYYVSMENLCGTTRSKKVAITHTYLPEDRTIQIDGDTIFCEGENVHFSIDHTPDETWTWYSSAGILNNTTASIEITEPGIYGIDIHNACGTITVDQNIPVSVLEIPPQAMVKDFYQRCGPGNLEVTVKGGEDGSYVWYDEFGQKIGGLNSDSITVPLDASKEYIVTITNGYCEGPASDLVMNVLEVPVADAGEDHEIINGDEITIGGEHQNTSTFYKWFPATWINNSSTPNPIVAPWETTTYILEAIGQNGCSAFDSVIVKVSYDLVIPNTFTPNNDGTNDTWHIRNIEFHRGSKVEIFNRWGSKLYEGVGYQNDWDGTYNGRNLPVDTYFYVIQLNDDQKPLKGPLTIIR